jgi:hypothetical protein
VVFNSTEENEITATSLTLIKKDSQGNVVDSVVDAVSFINDINLRLNNITLKFDTIFPNTGTAISQNIITPHDLTSNTSNPDFTSISSSSFGNDELNYGSWRCFDENNINNNYNWSSARFTYSNGNQTTGPIAPMTTDGSWVGAIFSSDKIITKLRYKAVNVNIPLDFTIFKFDGNLWTNTGFSVINASPTSNIYLDYNIPSENGGGGAWRGIAIVVSRVSAPDINFSNCLSIDELDFQ